MSAPSAPRASSAFDACLFDLDGTLIDSIELIYHSYEHTFRAHGLPVVDRERILSDLGRPLPDCFAAFARDREQIERLVATYRAFNLEHHDALLKPYPGASAAVDELRANGRRVGIVTSKKRDTALLGLRACGFEAPFDVFVALEDCVRHKPDPEPLLRALAALGLGPDHVCYVGDSPHDVAAGNAAGVAVFVAEWGPFSRRHFAGLDVAGWLDTPRALLESAPYQSGRM